MYARKLAVFAASALVALAVSTSAQALQFDLGDAFSGTPPPTPGPWLTADFTGTGNVTLTLTAGDLAGGYIDTFYFNYGGDSSLLSLTNTTPLVTTATVTQSTDCCAADGGGFYDVALNFVNANNSLRFTSNEVSIWTIALAGGSLTADDFNFLASPHGGNGVFTVAAHIAGYGDGLSAFVGDGGGEVPLPPAILLFGGALAGMGFLSRRRRAKQGGVAA